MKYLFLLGSFLSIATPAMAQEARETVITVVASGSRQVLSETGQSISVIGAEEIGLVQGPDLGRVLERVPGVTLTRNGGLGSFTGLRVRGADAEQLLVLIDGVRVADVAAPGGGHDLGTLMTGGIGKIELLRGSNSVVWGSQAMGGVLAVSSRELNGVEASAEYGAHDTLDGQVDAGLLGDGYSVGLSAGHTRSDGISSAAVGTEPDGLRQWRLGGRARMELAPGLSARVVGRYARTRLDIDGFPAPTYAFADTDEFQKARQISGRAGLDYSGKAIELRAGLALSDTRRRYYDPAFAAAPNYATFGRSTRADLGGRWRIHGGFELDFGADTEWTRFSSTFDAARRARQSSAHALLGWRGGPLSLAAGLRFDDHSRFGSEWTFGANGSLALGGAWRLRTSYGEGFKAPTLFQLHSDYGNALLSPERSRSYDLGIERGDRNAGLHLALTLFRRDSRDLIDFVSCFGVTSGICAGRPFGTYDNVARARAEGVELELGAQVSERVRAQAAWSWTRATNRTVGGVNRGNDLARRPRHALTASLDWRSPLRDLTLGADVRLVGDSFDDAGNRVRLDGHALATLRASLPVSEAIELFGRIENATDTRYETTAGYGTSGRAAFAGARARF